MAPKHFEDYESSEIPGEDDSSSWDLEDYIDDEDDEYEDDDYEEFESTYEDGEYTDSVYGGST